jgi:hypothetical protein
MVRLSKSQICPDYFITTIEAVLESNSDINGDSFGYIYTSEDELKKMM